jgi:ADP-heptose:LPS heptosyltransferase
LSTLIVRFSSLGDIVLTGSVTGALGAPAGDVHFLTARRYIEIAQALPGVHTVSAVEDGLPTGPFERIIDLHASMRSRWVCTKISGPVSRIQRFDLRRRARVVFKTAPAPAVVARYAKAAQVTPTGLPFLKVDGARDGLLICASAAHATKRWPLERYATIAQRWIETGRPVLLLGSHAESSQLQNLAEQIAHPVTVIAERGFSQTLAALGRGKHAVGGDTGLMHLCAAAGVPTTVLFGPTTETDGFWSMGGQSISHPLPCSPCSRHGSATCAFGDHHCMTQLTVDMVWKALTHEPDAP